MEGSAVLHRASAVRPRRAGRRPPFVQRYWAFLSYSHKDEEHAGWLHEAIEKYRVPQALVGRGTPLGSVPAKLSPIFRDRHELAAGGDLSADIQEALAGSRFLIVLCSPAAASSHWTNEEIRLFKQLRPDGEVLAAIVAGEPWAADIPGREAEECFPPALKQRVDGRGRLTGERTEPIAADLRAGRDGRRLGLLKIVAGMLGVGLDDLVQREAHRRQRRLVAITGASIAGMLLTSGLSVYAIQARDEAQDQRREAEGLVGFMLGDLKERLEPIGKLDALDAVGGRALDYFERQDKGGLSDEALAQRSKALTLMGEIAQRRGDLDGALRQYREALASTEESVRRDPENPQRVFEHAQNVFWVGYIDWQRGRMDEAVGAFRHYKSLAERMIALRPEEPTYRLEAIYADTNLGTVLMEQGQHREAARVYQSSLAPVERLASAQPGNDTYAKQLMETLAFIADATAAAGDLDTAIGLRERQLGLIQRHLGRSPGNSQLMEKAMVAHRGLAVLFTDRGELGTAIDHGRKALAIGDRLMATEPENADWMERMAPVGLAQSQRLLTEGRTAEAAVTARAGCDAVNRLVSRDSTVVIWSGELRRACLVARGRLALASGNAMEALSLARQAEANATASREPGIGRTRDLVASRALVGEAYRALGRREESVAAWRSGLVDWGRIEKTPGDLAQEALLHMRLGSRSEALKLAGRLEAIGYRNPAFETAFKQGGRT